MEALRKIVKINNNILEFNMPVNFKSKYVKDYKKISDIAIITSS